MGESNRKFYPQTSAERSRSIPQIPQIISSFLYAFATLCEVISEEFTPATLTTMSENVYPQITQIT